MADDSRIIDGDKNDDEDIMLELSIGGIFGKPKKKNLNLKEQNLDDHDNVEYNRDIRRELKRKREENLKELVAFGSCGSVSGPFVENKEWLETQIGLPQNGDVLDVWKKEKTNGDNLVLRPMACRISKPCQAMNSNGCGGSSSGYSDGLCSCHQGNPTGYCRSISSNSQLDQQYPSTSTTTSDLLDSCDQPTGSSSQTVSLSVPSQVKLNDQLNSHTSISFSNSPKNHETDSQRKLASFLARMPCVSTTGNGPNGKRVRGFLYRYTKNEVTIVCICHGQSFSPGEFVEHAGGVDVVHPLKHITIFPTTFAS
uniref:ninja-family protein Os03g0419100 n=1 Tax=Erigeron canadensis TaxID=72917 RepID=UPI001CB8A123|nr:ninja-family protein Os03g0419100 [Erigeron canadensis]